MPWGGGVILGHARSCALGGGSPVGELHSLLGFPARSATDRLNRVKLRALERK